MKNTSIYSAGVTAPIQTELAKLLRGRPEYLEIQAMSHEAPMRALRARGNVILCEANDPSNHLILKLKPSATTFLLHRHLSLGASIVPSYSFLS
ncbi:hypothetical protein FRC03_009613 [Tulasnella sp. 419]|nr:hypothetical protein FRC03_009613 [Tulasnella sp. 419]